MDGLKFGGLSKLLRNPSAGTRIILPDGVIDSST